MNKKITLISAIILVYHDEKFLRNCVSSLRISAKLANIKLEIIIVVNDKNLKQEHFKFPHRCKLLFNNKNLGFGKSINRAAKIASGKWILLVNIDTVTEKFAIKYLIKHIDKNKIAVIAPMILNPDRSLQFTINNEINIRHLLEEQLYIHKIFNRNIRSPQANTEHYNYAHEIKYVFAAYLLIRKDIFISVSGFDERYFLYLEDIDLCKKINSMGFKIFYEPEAKIIHYLHQSNKGINNGKLYILSMKKYLKKWHGKFYSKFALFIIYIGSILRFLVWRIIEIIVTPESVKREAKNRCIFYKDAVNYLIKSSIKHPKVIL